MLKDFVLHSLFPQLQLGIIFSDVFTSSLTLTPFEESDFLLEEVNAFLALEDDPTLPEVDQSYFDPKGDILLLEAFLNDDPSSPPPNQGNYLPEVRKELKICEAKSDKSSIDEPPEVKLKDLPSYLEYAFLEGDDKSPVIITKYLSVEEKTALIMALKSHKQAIAWKLFDIKGINPKFYTHKIFMEEDFEPAVQHQRRVNPKIHDGIVLGHKISKEGIEVDKAKVDVIAKLPHPTTVKGIRSFLGHAGFYRRFIKDLLKIAPSMTRLLEKDTPFLFSKECVKAFQTLKIKLTKAPILIAPDWDLPFELMCDASDFAIEFKFKVTDTKGAENLATDHLSRLENPHQNVLDPKEINESFPLETLNMVYFCGNSSTPWFADFANYHAGNFAINGMSFQQKNTFFQRCEALLLERFRNVMKCHKIPSKFAIFSTFEALTSWFRSRARFRTPRAIISDRGTHFCNDQFAKVMFKYGVTHRLAITYHPQTSG
uniref:Integrase catalytic domain-containing protein n=1 Tax=Tanacetum cinerariifolium TaxID=118510 RepID=A0A699HVY0_TANCI|nr:hypothetical protein [Tanacetum cinerariifolium]